MQFLEFRDKIKNLPGFSLNDIRKIDPFFHKRQLMDWLKRGYIRSFAGEYYLLADQQMDEPLRFMLANRLYEPSYISLESALAFYHIIPEAVLSVTSISSRKSKQFESDWGLLYYRSIKPLLMFGYEVIETAPNRKYSIASLEKAVLDYLYLNSHIASIEDFEGLRWDRDALFPVIGSDRFRDYQNIFSKKALDKRVYQLMRYINA
jgi:predicted transcriptional regulator of viral defense system